MESKFEWRLQSALGVMSSSDSYLVIWEFEYLELQYPIISIFGSGFLKFISWMYLVNWN